MPGNIVLFEDNGHSLRVTALAFSKDQRRTSLDIETSVILQYNNRYCVCHGNVGLLYSCTLTEAGEGAGLTMSQKH